MAIQLRITVLTTEFKVILFLGQKSANFFFLTPSPKFSNLLNFFSEHLKIDVGRYEIYIMKRKLARQFLLLVKHSTGNHTLSCQSDHPHWIEAGSSFPPIALLDSHSCQEHRACTTAEAKASHHQRETNCSNSLRAHVAQIPIHISQSARIFLTFFHHVLVPKIGNLLPKTLKICMLFGHFLLSLSSKYHHNYHWTVIMIIGIFLSYVRNESQQKRRDIFAPSSRSSRSSRSSSHVMIIELWI